MPLTGVTQNTSLIIHMDGIGWIDRELLIGFKFRLRLSVAQLFRKLDFVALYTELW